MKWSLFKKVIVFFESREQFTKTFSSDGSSILMTIPADNFVGQNLLELDYNVGDVESILLDLDISECPVAVKRQGGTPQMIQKRAGL